MKFLLVLGGDNSKTFDDGGFNSFENGVAEL